MQRRPRSDCASWYPLHAYTNISHCNFTIKLRSDCECADRSEPSCSHVAIRTFRSSPHNMYLVYVNNKESDHTALIRCFCFSMSRLCTCLVPNLIWYLKAYTQRVGYERLTSHHSSVRAFSRILGVLMDGLTIINAQHAGKNSSRRHFVFFFFFCFFSLVFFFFFLLLLFFQKIGFVISCKWSL